jgi:hypothetical protein
VLFGLIGGGGWMELQPAYYVVGAGRGGGEGFPDGADAVEVART